MNILWISNVLFPEADNLLNGNKSGLKTTGGWMIGAAEALINQPNVHLYVASISRRVRKLTCLQGEKIIYYILPGGYKGTKKINHGLEKYWRIINNIIKPDVVHLHGTEFTHGLAYIEACGADNVCVSIQGLVSAYAPYYYYGLSRVEILRASTLRSFLRGGIMNGYRDFLNRSKSEIEIIKRVNHIIGRTQWDKDRTWAINPKAQYHYGGETLRKEFYDNKKWDYSSCRPHSIFLSQAAYPIKGLHMVLKAIPLVLRHFPDTTIRIAGSDITNSSKWSKRLFLSNYGIIIDKIIRENNLKGCASFTGPLDAEEMCQEYLKSNIFICPSSIENSPNSVGEAQVLGVPVIASYVGGVPDMMKGNENNLYRFEEIEMLAHRIVDMFSLEDRIETEEMRIRALSRHNPKDNVQQLLSIYSVVSSRV